VALGVGTYGMVRNRKLVGDFDRNCANDPDAGPYALPGSTRTDAGCGDLKRDYRTAGTVGAVGLIAGVLLAAGGVVLLVTDPPPAAAPSHDVAAWTCAPGAPPGRGFDLSLGCAFRF
jgi:hypothetical protein